MNSKIRILIVVALTAIYCFAIGIVNNTLFHSDFNTNPSALQEKVISDFSEKLFCHSSQNLSSVNNHNSLSAPNFKNQFSELLAILRANDKLYESKFSQYTKHSRTILTNYRKSDIIFPFHYFW